LIKWLIAKGRPIKEEVLDAVDVDEDEEAIEVLMNDQEVEAVEEAVLQDLRKARKTTLEDGFQ